VWNLWVKIGSRQKIGHQKFWSFARFKNYLPNSCILFTKPYALAHGLSQTLYMSAPSEKSSPTTQASHTNDPTVAAQNEPALSTTNDDSDHLAIVKSLLQDPLLKDVPANPTLEEVKTLIAIEEGRAYRIRIERKGLQDIREFGFCVYQALAVLMHTYLIHIYLSAALVVSQATNVKQIKNLVQLATKRMLRNQGSKRSINW
jgi:hypothetical protein